LAALAFLHFREKPPAVEVTRFQFPLPPGQNDPALFPAMEFSPDGRKLAFVAMSPDVVS